jgi:voltage-gated potassium channel
MRQKLYDIIFGTTTKAGRNFDVVLLFLILFSVVVVMIESVPNYRLLYGQDLQTVEWIFTIIFTIEYILRIAVSKRPLRYIFSFWGIIDLLSILPTFISPFLAGYTSLIVVRALRLLRIFRILKLSRFTSESQTLMRSLKASYYKIMVFLFFVVMMIVLAGTLMYVIEGGENGFDSIPIAIYWAVVTVTTVGYGDIAPITATGKMLASVMMILGYAIIAVPTGLISVEFAKGNQEEKEKDNICDNCVHNNRLGSLFCSQCGREMEQ